MVKKNDDLGVKAPDDSDSSEHCKSEAEVLRRIEEQFNCHFTGEKLDLGGGVMVEVDGIDREKKILCEVYCHIGKLIGSQPDKVAADVLKLVFVDQAMGGQWNKLLCFASKEAAAYCQGSSWLSAAIRQAGCEVRVVELPADRVQLLEERQIINAQGSARVRSHGGLAALADFAESLPANPDGRVDGAEQHDHYLYGSPKR